MANRLLPPGQSYSGRTPGVVVKTFTLDRYAAELLQELVPTTKSHGAFIAVLILAEHARREERRRLRQVLDAATAGEGS